MTNLAVFVYTSCMNQSPYILIDQQKQDNISVFDRGLAYGDGLFETMKVDHGKIALWQYHYERLFLGLKRLSIPLNKSSLFEQLNQSLDYFQSTSGVLKLIVTRHQGGRGYAPPIDSKSTLVSIADPSDKNNVNQSRAEKGVSVHYCNEYLSVNASLAGIKSLNQLSYVLASQERQGLPFDEGLLFSSQGHLIEATSRNVFLVKGGELYTPLLDQCGVEGVLRRLIIEDIAPEIGMVAHECLLTKLDIQQADEIFVTNSITGVWPVIRCNEIEWVVGVATQKIQRHVTSFLQFNTSLAYSLVDQ